MATARMERWLNRTPAGDFVLTAILAFLVFLSVSQIITGRSVTATFGNPDAANHATAIAVSGIQVGQEYAGETYNENQVESIKAILQACADLGLNEQDTIITLITARQESTFINDPSHKDDWWLGNSDSRGIFQQRNPYGTEEDRMNAYKATVMFLEGVPDKGIEGLLDIPNRASVPESDWWKIAADVQRPAAQFERDYQQHLPVARAILAAAKTTRVSTGSNTPLTGTLKFQYSYQSQLPADLQGAVEEAGLFWGGIIADNKTIALQVIAVDTPETWFAAAKPTQFDANGLPTAGTLKINTRYQGTFKNNPKYFRAMVIHEMAHVLGIGTVWSPKGLIQGTQYQGKNGAAYYGGLIPTDEAGGHWAETLSNGYDGGELMTPFINEGDHVYIGEITLGSLQDIGWNVSLMGRIKIFD